MSKKLKPSLRQVGTAMRKNGASDGAVTSAELASELRRIRKKDRGAYDALMVVISRMVEKSSTR